MTTAYAMLGPYGALDPIPDPQAAIATAGEIPSSERITLGGVRVVQSAARGPRSWSWTLGPWVDPATVAYLAACASGVVPGPLYLYLWESAQMNLLPDHIASPGLGFGSLGPTPATVPVVLPGAGLTPTLGVVSTASAGPWSQTIPVLPSTTYTLSAWSTSAGAAVQARRVDATGAAISSTYTVTTAANGGGFYGSVSIPGTAAVAGIQVRTGALATNVGGLQLTEGSTQAVQWLPGEGVPQVVVSMPQRTLQLVRAGIIRADVTVTLREVGL